MRRIPAIILAAVVMAAVIHFNSVGAYTSTGKICVFEDVTDFVGLAGVTGSRFAWGDYDGDGNQDLLIDGWKLYRNTGPPDYEFEYVSEEAGLLPGSVGGVFADIDNDGDLDIFSFARPPNPDRLYINNGNGTFTDITLIADVSDMMPTEDADWADFNLDGFVDLYIVNYENWELQIDYPDVLYLNNGNLSFTNVTVQAGVYRLARGRSACWADFDNDGDPDLYVGNYRLQPNFLFINNGNGTFTEAAEELGVAGVNRGGYYGHTIGTAWGDFNNDGYLDLLVANLAHKDPYRGPICDDSKLYLNMGPPYYRFVDVREDAGIPIHPVGSVREGYYYDELFAGVVWCDFDCDGDLDFYVNQVYDIPFAYSFLYINNGDGTFTDVTEEANVRVIDGWGCAWCDYNNDGYPDLITRGRTSVHGARLVRLFKNKGTSYNWIEIKLIGTISNRAAIGARVKIVAGDLVQIREVEGGASTGCQNSLVVHFGVKRAKKVDLIEVRWPSGIVQRFRDVPVNRIVTVIEGKVDISIMDVSVSNENPKHGENVTFKVDLASYGTFNSSDENVGIRMIVDGEVVDEREVMVKAYSSNSTYFTWKALGGEHEIKFVVDPENSICEANEENNVKTISIDVKKLDILIENVKVTPCPAFEGETVKVEATLTCINTIEEINVSVHFIVDGKIVDSKIMRISEGTYIISFNWRALEGTHNLTILANLEGDIAEEDTENNSYSMDVTVYIAKWKVIVIVLMTLVIVLALLMYKFKLKRGKSLSIS